MVNIKINGISVSVQEGTTILDAAKKINIDIPTLCFLKGINENGSCRMCLVQIKNRRGLIASCIQKVEEGMEIYTNTPEIEEARKVNLSLLLSNHKKTCLTCTRDGKCELQELAKRYHLEDIEFEGERKEHEVDDLSPSIIRDMNKCILCGRCVSMCKNIQNIGAIDFINRGFNTMISPTREKSLNDVNCTNCGQCILVCPVGALREKDDSDRIFEKINDKNTHVIVQTAPSVRVALGEEFGMPIGTNVQGKMVTALKMLGFDKVFDTNTAADFTIVEEGTEFIERLRKKENLPLITSCSPGWVKYIEMNYPELLNYISTCKSPHEMYGALIKTYYAEMKKINPKDIYVVSVMPCVAKKFEASREELQVNGMQDVDCVITTRELAQMIKRMGIDFSNLEDSEFDNPMGEASGAAAIFGTTGGVMEAALRTVVEILSGKDLEKIEFEEVRGEKGIKEATINVSGMDINIAVASSLKNAKILLEKIKEGNCKYHFIEIMACPGGCIMGGGQPIKSSKELSKYDVRKLRADALYTIDEKSTIRKSHENPIVKKIYKDFLVEPGSKKAHEILHTKYQKRDKYK